VKFKAKKPVGCLGRFIDYVSEPREAQGLAKHKELWFRGEGKDYGGRFFDLS
jgi:hypothetical protein